MKAGNGREKMPVGL